MKRKRTVALADNEPYATTHGYNLRPKRRKLTTSDPPLICKNRTRVVRPSKKRKRRAPRSQRTGLTHMPSEIFQSIFRYLSHEELAGKLRLVNKQCRHIAQLYLNFRFHRLHKLLSRLYTKYSACLDQLHDDNEIRAMCKQLYVLEMVRFHYAIIRSTIWRHIHRRCTTVKSNTCMYAGSILDLFYKIYTMFVTAPETITGPLLTRGDTMLPAEVSAMLQQSKTFMLYFDRVTESPMNTSVFVVGAKVIDLLDAAGQVTREVVTQRVRGNALYAKFKYYFSNSWFVALDIPQESHKDWKEQMRLLYMRVRRIVVSHTEMHLEYAAYRRELVMRANVRNRPRRPMNSVYTGYGEVCDKFFFYGVMNDGAYATKFDDDDVPDIVIDLDDDVDDIDDDEEDDDVVAGRSDDNDSDGGEAVQVERDALVVRHEQNGDRTRNMTTCLGLYVYVSLRCPLQLAPLSMLEPFLTRTDKRNHNRFKENRRSTPIRGLFEMSINFKCPAAQLPKLPTSYTITLRGKRR